MKAPWDYIGQGTPETGVPNLPSPEGEALGVEIARMAANSEADYRARFPDAPPMCNDCAFRGGTEPNRRAATLMTALKCVIEREPFYCHKGIADADAPKRLCGGWCVAEDAMHKGMPMEADHA